MSSGVHGAGSLVVEIRLNENTRKFQIGNLPTNIKITALRQTIFKEIELVDDTSYKLLFSQTQKSLSKRNIQQIFQGQEGHAILKKEAGEESVKSNSPSSSSSEKTDSIVSQKPFTSDNADNIDDHLIRLPASAEKETTKEKTFDDYMRIPGPQEVSSSEKRNVGVIFVIALLILTYSARRYFYGNVKPKPSLQELTKATPQKI